MEFLCYGTSQQTTVTPDRLASKPRHLHCVMCRSNPTSLSLLLHVHMWMDDCIVAEKLLLQINNCTSTQTVSSPVQVTPPSSTQDSFAKSTSPARFVSLRFSLCLSLPLFPLSSLPPRSKDGRWWFGCQRPHRWMGNSHWVNCVGGMPHSECNTFEISGPLETMLQIQWFCCGCSHFYIVAHDVGFSVLL